MKICQPHWDMLCQAIKDRGIDHLVAKNGQEAIAAINADLAGEERPYDPLMACHWMITNRALKLGGLYLMGMKDDGTHYCPVCEAVAHNGVELNWINGPADAALRHCRETGLIPAVS